MENNQYDYKEIRERGYYIRFYPRIVHRNYFLVYFNSHKIDIYTFIERLSKKLLLYGFSKSFIKSFCSHIKREVKKELQLYTTLKKRKNCSTKKVTHLFKGNSEFRIGGYGYNLGYDKGMGVGYGKFENMVRELKSCKIVDIKSIKNLYNLRKLLPYLNNEFRFHEFRWVFNSIDIDILDVIRYIVTNGTIRDANFSIWANNTTTQKATSIIVSISSRANSKLCNLELWNRGFEQIHKRLPSDLALKLCLKMYVTKFSVEFGNSIYKNKRFIQKLGFNFLPKIYKVYNLNYWLDSSHKGVELEFKFNCYYTDLYNMINFIGVFNSYIEEEKRKKEFEKKLLKLGIMIIEPFSPENINSENGISLETKRCYKLRDSIDLVRILYKQTIIKDS